MERKVQEHKQELERLQQATKLDKARLMHEAKLKKEALSVSSIHRSTPCMVFCLVLELHHKHTPPLPIPSSLGSSHFFSVQHWKTRYIVASF